ncbi:MAG: hypothetical protein ACK559_08775, partial [bacterium]
MRAEERTMSLPPARTVRTDSAPKRSGSAARRVSTSSPSGRQRMFTAGPIAQEGWRPPSHSASA